MIEECIEQLERVSAIEPDQHRCRLYHDSALASEAEIVQLEAMGLESELLQNGGYLRPLCLDTRPDAVSVGCAHRSKPRKDIISVLEVLAAQNDIAARCHELIAEIDSIDHAINDGDITSLEYKMRHFRDVHTDEGAQKREEISDAHSELVDRLLEINSEVLRMYHS